MMRRIVQRCQQQQQYRIQGGRLLFVQQRPPQSSRCQPFSTAAPVANSAGGNVKKQPRERRKKRIVGVDEAGRGSVVGPLVVAAVSLSRAAEQQCLEAGVRDSKDVHPEKRQALTELIRKVACEVIVERVSAEDIDAGRARDNETLNTIECTAMAKCLTRLTILPKTVVVDSIINNAAEYGRQVKRELDDRWRLVNVVAETKADSKYVVVAAASIIAKTVRDEDVRKIGAVDGIELGSGYPSDTQTQKYLNAAAAAASPSNMVLNRHIRYSWNSPHVPPTTRRPGGGGGNSNTTATTVVIHSGGGGGGRGGRSFAPPSPTAPHPRTSTLSADGEPTKPQRRQLAWEVIME